LALSFVGNFPQVSAGKEEEGKRKKESRRRSRKRDLTVASVSEAAVNSHNGGLVLSAAMRGGSLLCSLASALAQP
jgi:hypothetical protein